MCVCVLCNHHHHDESPFMDILRPQDRAQRVHFLQNDDHEHLVLVCVRTVCTGRKRNGLCAFNDFGHPFVLSYLSLSLSLSLSLFTTNQDSLMLWFIPSQIAYFVNHVTFVTVVDSNDDTDFRSCCRYPCWYFYCLLCLVHDHHHDRQRLQY